MAVLEPAVPVCQPCGISHLQALVRNVRPCVRHTSHRAYRGTDKALIPMEHVCLQFSKDCSTVFLRRKRGKDIKFKRAREQRVRRLHEKLLQERPEDGRAFRHHGPGKRPHDQERTAWKQDKNTNGHAGGVSDTPSLLGEVPDELSDGGICSSFALVSITHNVKKRTRRMNALFTRELSREDHQGCLTRTRRRKTKPSRCNTNLMASNTTN